MPNPVLSTPPGARPSVSFRRSPGCHVSEQSCPAHLHVPHVDPPSPEQLLRMMGQLPQVATDEPPASSVRHSLVVDAVACLVELHNVAMDMASARGEYELIETAIRGARQGLGLDRLAVFLRDGDTVRGTVGTSATGEVVDERSYRMPLADLPERELVERALSEKNYLAIQEGLHRTLDDRETKTGWNAMVSLWAPNEALGWVACDNLLSGQPLSPFNVEVLKIFAGILTSALVRGRAEAALLRTNRELEARLRQQAEELAEKEEALRRASKDLEMLSRVDALTGIANRHAFDAGLLSEWGRCARESAELSVLVVDVDRFTTFNEVSGSEAGDLVLRRVADALARCVKRPGDLLARYEGDAFALVLPKTGPLGASRLAEQCRDAVAALQVIPSGKDAPLTVSIGVATARPPRGAAQGCVEAAEAAVYDARRRGGNFVAVQRG